jgi:GNAT superfamily N-acetyltransferase
MTSSISQARVKDAGDACNVVRRSIQAWLANKTTRNFAAWIGAPGALSFLAKAAHLAVGFGLATADGELALLYVVPQVHGTGVGRALLAALETAGRRAGLTEFRLESTATAREFYVRNGFSSAGEPSSGWGIIGYPMYKAL